MKASLWMVLAWLALGMVCPSFADELSDTERAAQTITQDELKQFVTFLASDSLQGREAGTAGSQAAGAFLVSELKRSKLKPDGDGGDWFQTFSGAYRNIVAVLPGSDDKLKHEFILVGAHYDHVGFGTPRNSKGPIGFVHNGADDNASGCAAVLELIEALDELKTKPRRSLLFVFWDGEEKGLLGSRHFVSQPTHPLSTIRFTLNADMMGRLPASGLQLQGWRTATGLRQFFAQCNTDLMTLDFDRRYVPDSDHWPFFERGIPSIMLHTDKHEDYHRPSDDAEKINYVGLRDGAKFLFRCAVELANAEETPAFRELYKSEINNLSLQPGWMRAPKLIRPAPARLGVSYDPELAEKGLVRITRVEPGSPSALGGIESGDEIMEFAGQVVKDWPEFRTLVVTADSETDAVLKRGDEMKTVKLKLRGEPIRVGCKTQTDEAEPGCAIVTEVTAGTPADVAGLRVGQRIWQIAGEPMSKPDSAAALFTAASPVEVQIEESGRIRTLMLKRVKKR